MSRADEQLAGRWGVSAMLVMQLRKQHLKEPDDFTATPQVTFTAAGEKKMAALLQVSPSEKKEGGAATGVAADVNSVNPWTTAAPSTSSEETATVPGSSHALPETVGMLVLKVWPNPTFVTVRTPAGAEEGVRVKHNTRLQRGHTLRCRQWPDGRVECVHPGLHVPLPALA